MSTGAAFSAGRFKPESPKSAMDRQKAGIAAVGSFRKKKEIGKGQLPVTSPKLK